MPAIGTGHLRHFIISIVPNFVPMTSPRARRFLCYRYHDVSNFIVYSSLVATCVNHLTMRGEHECLCSFINPVRPKLQRDVNFFKDGLLFHERTWRSSREGLRSPLNLRGLVAAVFSMNHGRLLQESLNFVGHAEPECEERKPYPRDFWFSQFTISCRCFLG